MRRFISSLAVLSVLGASLISPYLHLHKSAQHGHDDSGLHEHSALVHAHISDLPISTSIGNSEAVTTQEDEHDAESFASFYLTRQVTYAVHPVDLTQRTVFPECSLQAFSFVNQYAPRTHDPPLLAVSVPRAPPA